MKTTHSTIAPYNNYKNGWTDFREATNETLVTAKHLVNHTSIQRKRDILDLGSGDGSLLRLILQHPETNFKKALFVEIDNNLYSKAIIEYKYCIPEIRFLNVDFTKIDISVAHSYEAILASHVFYLIDEVFLIKLLNYLKKGQTLYIILNEPYSVFGSFWIHTAPFYHERLKKLHYIFNSLNARIFTTEKTAIHLKMKNPFLLPEDKKQNILSFLSYRQLNQVQKNDLDFCEKTIDKFLDRNKTDLNYLAYCYEVRKR